MVEPTWVDDFRWIGTDDCLAAKNPFFKERHELWHEASGQLVAHAFDEHELGVRSVSYTHLTLPTIYSV